MKIKHMMILLLNLLINVNHFLFLIPFGRPRRFPLPTTGAVATTGAGATTGADASEAFFARHARHAT